MILYSLLICLSLIYGLLSETTDNEFDSSIGFNETDLLSNDRSNSSRMLSFFQRPSLLNIVRFPNEECFDASNQSGTCYTPFECKKLGGFPSSPCAKGLGACCIVSRSCHNTTSNRVVYFRNPSYPQSDTQQNFCDLTVNIYDSDVCQLRLDFLDFQLDQPTLGNCLGDKFRVSASGFAPTSVPVLCGLNRNQHIYVSLPRDTTGAGDRSASIVFETNSEGDYRWHVRVTQIICNYGNNLKKNIINTNVLNTNLLGGNRLGRKIYYGPNGKIIPILNPQTQINSLPAPMGCLQYFTQSSGLVESFNFGEYLNNLDYAICIERQPSTCKVTFTASDFLWSIDSAQTDKTRSAVGDQDCPSDYLLIPAASQTGDGFTYDRFCGGKLHYQGNQLTEAPVVSKANGPIVLRFHSDATQDETVKDGFRLNYVQSSSDCLPQFSLNNGLFGPTPVVQNLAIQYIADKPLESIDLEKQEPFIYISKPESRAKNNAKKLKL